MIGLPTDPEVVHALQVLNDAGIASPAELRQWLDDIAEQIRVAGVPAFTAMAEQVTLAAAAFTTLRPAIARWNRQEVYARRRAGRPRSRRRPGRTRRRR